MDKEDPPASLGNKEILKACQTCQNPNVSTKMVVSALQEISMKRGMPPTRIVGYISYATNMPNKKIKKQVYNVLKQGVRDGYLKKYRGSYSLSTGIEPGSKTETEGETDPDNKTTKKIEQTVPVKSVRKSTRKRKPIKRMATETKAFLRRKLGQGRKTRRNISSPDHPLKK